MSLETAPFPGMLDKSLRDVCKYMDDALSDL